MDAKKAEMIMNAVAGMPYKDWQAIAEMVERKYQTAMRKTTISSHWKGHWAWLRKKWGLPKRRSKYAGSG